MFCGNCGVELEEGAAFCQKCGTKVAGAVKPAMQTNSVTATSVINNPSMQPKVDVPDNSSKKSGAVIIVVAVAAVVLIIGIVAAIALLLPSGEGENTAKSSVGADKSTENVIQIGICYA